MMYRILKTEEGIKIDRQIVWNVFFRKIRFWRRMRKTIYIHDFPNDSITHKEDYVFDQLSEAEAFAGLDAKERKPKPKDLVLRILYL